jgi:DNA-3-methyladenine glycosylase II
VLCRELADQDEDLAFIFRTCGTPPLWSREPVFATLVHIILEQQVSLASALSAFNKLKERLGDITPEGILSLPDEEMKAAYFSRQKTAYARGLAEAILEKRIDLKALEKLPDETVKFELKKLKGIGDWTADIYLLMAMLRADIMPKGDLALHIAWRKLHNLPVNPGAEEFLQIAERWKPLRSVAARLLWHFYLSERNNQSKQQKKQKA